MTTTSKKNICDQIAEVYSKYNTHASVLTKGTDGSSLFYTRFKTNGIKTHIECVHVNATSIDVKQDDKLVIREVLEKSAKLNHNVLEMENLLGTKCTIQLPIPDKKNE